MKAERKLEWKNHAIAMLGEFVGTMMFLFIALGATNVAQIPTNSTKENNDPITTSSLLYISLAFGFSLAVNAWIFFRVSGGLFNPAVSLALVLVGALPALRGALLVVAQLAGAIAGAGLISTCMPGNLNASTALAQNVSYSQGIFLEAICTMQLIFAVLMLAAEKHKATFLAPIGIGLALFVSEMVSVYYTGGSLNPARSFGPDVVIGKFKSDHWVYWVGPLIGTIIASLFYKVIKWAQYETVVPDQDASMPHEDFYLAGVSNRGTLMNLHALEEGRAKPAGSTAQPNMESRVVGPGINNLTTAGDQNKVYKLTPPPGETYEP